MSQPELHPWLSTPEALKAAKRAVSVPTNKMPAAARVVGSDELLSEAIAILTECGLPQRDRKPTACAACGGSLEAVRAGAKFCSTKCKHNDTMRRRRADRKEAVAAPPKGHVGSMWTWPEDKREAYAVREVGLQLCNYLRTRSGRLEIPATPGIENANIPVTSDEDSTAREVIEDYLVSCGIEFDGTETTEELAEAAQWLVKRES